MTNALKDMLTCARELGIPAIVGTEKGTEKIKNGAQITVSCAEGEEGKVYMGALKFQINRLNLKNLKKPSTKIMMNLGNPDQAFELSFLPVDGVGLAREEFIINSYIGVHPLALLHFDKLKDKSAKEKIEKLTNMGPVPEEFKCPICGSAMIWKLSKNGKFMSCSKFPECTGARTEAGEELQGPKETGEECPQCGKGKLVERDGRFGRFIACANYPKCKFVKKDPAEEERAKTGVACPVCGKGEMVERRGRFGVFYSCSNYPQCKNAIKARPTGKICSLCGSLMMEGTKTIPERCSNKQCPMHNPHKLHT